MKTYTKITIEENGENIEKVQVSFVEFGIEMKREYTKGMAYSMRDTYRKKVNVFEDQLSEVPKEEKFFAKVKYLNSQLETHKERLEEILEVCNLLNIK